jgi:hypothetical protein
VAISEADLLEAAGPRSFERGAGYVGAVHGLTVLGSKVTASVRGTDDYIVILTLPEDGGVTGICDCPYGQEGFFCKHCVAVGLAFLRHAVSRDAVSRDAVSRDAVSADDGSGDDRSGDETDAENLVTWLAAMSHDELLDLVIGRVVEDAEWRRQLDLRAAAAWVDIDAMIDRLVPLLDPGGFGEYGYVEEGESRRYASRVMTAKGVVDDLAAGGRPGLAATLARYAIELVSGPCQYANDPAGAIWNAAAELMSSHLGACLEGDVEPGSLAGFLAGRMLSGDDMPKVDVAAYREALGPAGESKLRELLGSAAAEHPSLVARNALADFHRAVGDVDALVAAMAADLPPTGLGHLRIAEELGRAGRAGEALDWAERGLRAAGTRSAPKLADFLVTRYTELGRLDDAFTVRRDAFAAARSVLAYDQLKQAAQRTGTWPETKRWALDRLRADAEAARPQQGLRVAGEPVLLDVLISEDDLDAAWEAAEGVASEAQWRRLADLVGATRPADALAVYLRQLKPLRTETGDRVYERIADLLIRARDCHRRLGTEADFDTYLRYLRLEQKRKPKLMSILDARGLKPAQGLATSKSARTGGTFSGSPA